MALFYICGLCDRMRKINDRIDDFNYQHDINVEIAEIIVKKNDVQSK